MISVHALFLNTGAMGVWTLASRALSSGIIWQGLEKGRGEGGGCFDLESKADFVPENSQIMLLDRSMM